MRLRRSKVCLAVTRHALVPLVMCVLALFSATCSAPTDPTPVDVMSILSITPSSGPTSGGTSVTIRGARFAAGAAITIGGRAATDVIVQSADMITAKTPAGATASAVDVAVTANGQTATLAGGFRYQAVVQNALPVIRSLAGQGKRRNQPANFADHGETIQITAVVEDADTPATQLVYQWEACGGTFIGSGPQVEWQAPTTGLLPPACLIDLTVIDGTNRATSSITIRLHDSEAEVTSLALEFLNEFADSSIPAATTVRNFSDACQGKAAELKDVTDNRLEYIINSHTYGTPKVTVAFGGICTFRSRLGDACFSMPAEWRSTKKSTGTVEVAKGIAHITAVYSGSRWWLCWSDYQGQSGSLRFLQ